MDGQVFPQGSVNYYQRMLETMGGSERTASFARLFLAPGFGHCIGGSGPAPADTFGALVDWVEHRQAPDTLLANKTDPATGRIVQSRPLCPYPLVGRYAGNGGTDDARQFTCAREFPKVTGCPGEGSKGLSFTRLPHRRETPGSGRPGARTRRGWRP